MMKIVTYRRGDPLAALLVKVQSIQNEPRLDPAGKKIIPIVSNLTLTLQPKPNFSFCEVRHTVPDLKED